MTDTTRQTCFVIAPIGEEGSDTRKRSDQILKHLIEPAATECGFIALRADKISEPGLITSQVIQHILDDPLVIADLTGSNPNVFYELAIRHAIAKPIVQLIHKGEPIPFDIAVTRIIYVDHRDLDSVSAAHVELVKHIQSALKDPKQVDTPITMALNLKLLRESSSPEKESITALLDITQNMRLSFQEFQHTLKDFYANYDMARMFEKQYLIGIQDSLLIGQQDAKKQSVTIEMLVDELHRLQDFLGAR